MFLSFILVALKENLPSPAMFRPPTADDSAMRHGRRCFGQRAGRLDTARTPQIERLARWAESAMFVSTNLARRPAVGQAMRTNGPLVRKFMLYRTQLALARLTACQAGRDCAI